MKNKIIAMKMILAFGGRLIQLENRRGRISKKERLRLRALRALMNKQ